MTLKLLLGYPIAKSLARSLESCEGGRVEHGSVQSFGTRARNLLICAIPTSLHEKRLSLRGFRLRFFLGVRQEHHEGVLPSLGANG